jgi:hypothetical protein
VNAQHIELADQITEYDCAVAGHLASNEKRHAHRRQG